VEQDVGRRLAIEVEGDARKRETWRCGESEFEQRRRDEKRQRRRWMLYTLVISGQSMRWNQKRNAHGNKLRVRKRKRNLEIEYGVDGRNGICEGYNGHTHRGQSPRFEYFVLSSVNASERRSLLPAAGTRYWSIGILARIY
jgi:hypothetical protein